MTESLNIAYFELVSPFKLLELADFVPCLDLDRDFLDKLLLVIIFELFTKLSLITYSNEKTFTLGFFMTNESMSCCL